MKRETYRSGRAVKAADSDLLERHQSPKDGSSEDNNLGQSLQTNEQVASDSKLSKTAPSTPAISRNSSFESKIHRTLEDIPSSISQKDRKDDKRPSISDESAVDKSDLDKKRRTLTVSEVTITATGSIKSKTNLKFQKMFQLDETEELIKSFSCALVDEILFQGKFYASRTHFCFFTRIANRRKSIKVPITEVTDITREKTAGIIPNAIAIHTKTDRYLFTSFMQRETTRRFLVGLWEASRAALNTFDWVSAGGSPIPLDADIASHNNKEGTHRRRVHSSHFLDVEDIGSENEDPSGAAGPVSRAVQDQMGHDERRRSCRHDEARIDPKVDDVDGNGSVFSLLPAMNPFYELPMPEVFLSMAYVILIIMTIGVVMFAWRIHSFQLILLEHVQTITGQESTRLSNQEPSHSIPPPTDNL